MKPKNHFMRTSALNRINQCNSYRFHSVLLILLIIGLQTIGQSSRNESYVILKNGEELAGKVVSFDQKRNPSQLSFKPAGESTTVLMTTADVIEFGFDGFRYISRSFRYDTRPYDLSRLSRSVEPIYNDMEGFLQVLVSGPVELYQFSDNFGQLHYLIGNGQRVDLLMHSRYRTEAMYGTKRENFVYQSVYKATLLNYFKDCEAVGVTDVTDVSYSANSLSDAIYFLGNRCGYAMKRHKIKNDRGINFGVTAGMKTSTLAFSYKYTTYSHLKYPHLSEAKFSNSTNFFVGTFLLVNFPWQNNRWSLYNELLGSSAEYAGTYQKVNANGNPVSYFTNVHVINLKIRTFWQYNQPLDRIALSYGIGLVIDSHYSEPVTKIIETLPDNRLNREQKSIKFHGGFGVAAAVGARYNKWEMRLYYERPGNQTKQQNNLFASMHEVGLGLSYRFL